MKKTSSFSVLAIVLMLLGLILILENFNIIRGALNLWPLLPLTIGFGFCLLFYKSKQKDMVLLGLGTFIILSSIFFFYLNFTNLNKLSYMWPLFITLLGVSFIPPYAFSKSRITIILGIFLIAIGLSFILIFAISTDLWPVSLVLAGASFLISSFFSARRRKKRIRK
ncbi:hypothetical protein ACFL0V_03450 [Nanoarchaeota archaeon]